MRGKVGLAVKKPGNKEKDTVSNKPKSEFSQQVSPDSLESRILHLQRTIGNRAVTRLIQSGAIQASLKIGQPGDIYEQEAERFAHQVMQMPEGSLARTESEPVYHQGLEEGEEGMNRLKREPGSIPGIVRDIESDLSEPIIRRLNFAERNSICSRNQEVAERNISQAQPIAARWAQTAFDRLENPDYLVDLLWRNFRVLPDESEKIETIRRTFYLLAKILNGDKFIYHCLSRSHPWCQGGAYGVGSPGTFHIFFCEPFPFVESIGNEPLAYTLLHEAAHAHHSLFRDDTYHYYRSYPGKVPLTNADSYACFARDLAGEQGRCLTI